MRPGGVVWIDGRIVPAAEAAVPVLDRGFLYGDSVYEVARTFSSGGGARRAHALGEHLDRLAASAARIGMTLPPRAAIEHGVGAAIASLPAGEDAYLRIIVTRGAGSLGLDPALADQPRLIVIALPLALPDPGLYRDGATVALVGARRNAPGGLDPQVKSGNYLSSVLAVAEARRAGAYEALMCDPVGRLSEGASSNVFVVKHGRARTPPLSVGLLEGITRRHVIAAARRLGIAVDEVPLWPEDLERADEAFLTSSVRGVMPIVRLHAGGDDTGGHAVAGGVPGPITRRVSDEYLREARLAG